ncbi:MAG TPA: FHA domain-containing protein, partial [Elusimicrobiota bacterium]|nr:FHA domain-containing protein [Elusimicrobiota bacterium]
MMVAGAPAWALASTALMALLLTRDYHQKVFYETEDGIVRQRTATWMERLGIFSWFTAFGVGSLAVTVLMTGAFVPSFAGLGPAEILQNLPVLARGLADSVLSVGTSSFWATPLQSLRELAGASAAVLGPLVGGFTAGLLGHSGVNLARRREGRAFLTGNDSKGRGFFGNLVSLATDLMGLKPTNTIVEVGPAGKPITLADTNHITGSREPTIGYKINYDPIYDRDLLERSKAIQTWALNQENYGLIRGFSGEIDGPRSGQHSGRTWWAAVPLAAKDKIVEALKAGNLADPDVNRYLSHNVRRYLASPKGQIWVTTLHDLVSQNPLESVEQDSLGDLVAHFTETNMPLNGVHAFSLEWNPGFELDFQRNIHPETGYDEVFPKDFDFFQWRLTRHISEALHRDLPGDLQKTAGEHTVAVFLNEDKTAVERVVVGSTQFGWRFSPETNAMVLPGDESHPDGRASVEEVQHRMIQLNVRTDETGRWQTERVRGFFNDLQLANHLLNRSGRVTNEGPATEESGPLVVSTVQPLPLMVVHQMGLPVGEFVPEKFVAELMNDRELGRIFLMGTETDEGHRLYQHTAMVLRQFERYFAASPRFQAALTKAGVDLGFFRLFMALHDIGKPEARAGRVGENEFDHTSRLIRRYFERHGLSSKQLDLALSLAGGDPIGQYLRANPPTSTEFLSARDPLFIALAQGTEPSPLAYKAAAEISANARRLELDVETYWELLTAYYQSDAGAYTTDAYYAENGRLNYGPTSLNALFDFTRTDGSFISPPWQLKMEPLQRLVLGVTPPTTTPPAALPEITGPTLLTPESGPHRLPQLPSRLLLANVHPVSLRIDHGNLVATGPDGSTAVLQPGQTLSIGRSPDENSVGLVIKAQDVKNVSRRHATVQWDGQTALVADLSPNGTYVKPGDPLGDEFDAKLRAALQSEIPAVMDGQTVKVNLSVYTNGEAARVFREDEAIPARDLQGFEPHEITVFARSADGHTVDATIGRVRDGLGSKIQTLQSLAVGQVRPLDFSAEFGTVGAAFSRVTEDVATALAALAKPRGRADIENIVYSLG